MFGFQKIRGKHKGKKVKGKSRREEKTKKNENILKINKLFLFVILTH